MNHFLTISRNPDNVEHLRQAREDSWRMWNWLAENPKAFKSDAPDHIFDRCIEDANWCPLCTMYKEPPNVCKVCPLYEAGYGCIEDEYINNGEHSKFIESPYDMWSCPSSYVKGTAVCHKSRREKARLIADTIKDWDIDGDGGLLNYTSNRLGKTLEQLGLNDNGNKEEGQT